MRGRRRVSSALRTASKKRLTDLLLRGVGDEPAAPEWEAPDSILSRIGVRSGGGLRRESAAATRRGRREAAVLAVLPHAVLDLARRDAEHRRGPRGGAVNEI